MIRPSIVKLAETMAKKSASKTYPMGAVIFNKKRIISAGYNQSGKTHPMMLQMNNPYIMGLHAEMHACIGVNPDDLKRASICVVRLRKNSKYGLAKPCMKCLVFLTEVGIRKVIYSTNNSTFETLKVY